MTDRQTADIYQAAQVGSDLAAQFIEYLDLVQWHTDVTPESVAFRAQVASKKHQIDVAISQATVDA